MIKKKPSESSLWILMYYKNSSSLRFFVHLDTKIQALHTSTYLQLIFFHTLLVVIILPYFTFAGVVWIINIFGGGVHSNFVFWPLHRSDVSNIGNKPYKKELVSSTIYLIISSVLKYKIMIFLIGLTRHHF